MMTVSFVLVIAVVAILVYITISKKSDVVVDFAGGPNGQYTEQNINMQQQGEQPKVEEKNISTQKGVQIIVLREGSGNPVKAGDTVAMNYTGSLTNGTVFDSNVDPNFKHVEPFVFTLGAGRVIKGWDIGVSGMKLGEKRKLVIDPEFGYGANGAGASIPPNATLNFEVELIGIKQ